MSREQADYLDALAGVGPAAAVHSGMSDDERREARSLRRRELRARDRHIELFGGVSPPSS